MKLLHLDSSALGANSVTRELSAAVAARWQEAHPGLTVEYRDLVASLEQRLGRVEADETRSASDQ